MKILLLCTLAVVVTAMCACGEDCKGFPDELTPYLPYKKGQIITFTNEYNNTFSAQVSSISRTAPYYIKFGCKCACSGVYEVYLPVISDNAYGYDELMFNDFL